MDRTLQLPAQCALLAQEEMTYLNGGGILTDALDSILPVVRDFSVGLVRLPFVLVGQVVESFVVGLQVARQDFIDDITNPNFHAALAMSLGFIAFMDLLMMAIEEDTPTQPEPGPGPGIMV